MASTFFGLQISGSGLKAANASMNTTANNISNADTDGYSRQKTVQQATNALRTFTTYGCAGGGVDTLAIERIRDEFYDTKYRENETKLGEYDKKKYYMELIQDYFTDDGKTGFSTVYTRLKTAMQEVLKNAGSSTTKQSFISTGTTLLEYFNNLAENLKNLQKDVNSEVKVQTDQINSIAAELATLNKQINVVELNGAVANELRDKRDLLIDELSKIVDVKTTETPIYDANNPDRETGAYRYTVSIAGGQMLVDMYEYRTLECVSRESNNKMNQTDIVGLYDVYWSDGDQFNTTNRIMGGELAALFQLRDGNNGENFQGTVTSVNTSQNTATVRVTKEYLTDMSKCNLAEAGTINLGNKLYSYDSWSLTVSQGADGEPVYEYTFQLDDASQITTGKIDKSASIGSSIYYQGIPYYMEQMNEWLRLFANSFNGLLTSGYTDDGNPGVLMFTGTRTDATQLQMSDSDANAIFAKNFDFSDPAKTYTMSCYSDSYYLMTSDNCSIYKPLLDNANGLATKTAESKTDGSSQYDNIAAIFEMMRDKTQMSFRGCESGEFLTCLLGDVALNANSAETFTETYTSIENTLDNQRLSISGVDSDEEALHLVQFQNSYTLASKMISTFAEVYDQLILNTGV